MRLLLDFETRGEADIEVRGMKSIVVSGFVTSALVASNTILVSRISPSAIGVSFAISLCWAYAVGSMSKADTWGRLTYAAASAAGCGTALWIAS